ncbi:ribonuclease H-like domain-containing protein [Tanacetum coccineum]
MAELKVSLTKVTKPSFLSDGVSIWDWSGSALDEGDEASHLVRFDEVTNFLLWNLLKFCSIFVDGCEPFAQDLWKQIKSNETDFQGIMLCPRCKVLRSKRCLPWAAAGNRLNKVINVGDAPIHVEKVLPSYADVAVLALIVFLDLGFWINFGFSVLEVELCSWCLDLNGPVKNRLIWFFSGFWIIFGFSVLEVELCSSCLDLNGRNNDNSSLAIVNVKLVGAENYKMWAMAMKIALKGKKTKWSLLMILGFLSQELNVGQVYSEIALEVWNELKETYDKMDGYVVFNLMHKINNLKQGDLFVPDYCHKLNSLWREFDILTILPACVCEAKDPLPNAKDVFYVVSREESHRGLHPGSSSSSKVQPAAFIAKTNNNTNNFNRRVNGNNNNNNANRGPNPNLLCKNCGLIGHTIERCYEIIGYPTGFKRNPNLSRHTRNNNNKINANTEVNHSVPRTSGSISSFLPMNIWLPNFYNNNVFFNLNFKRFFCAKTKYDMYHVTLGWIIDYEANQHMTDSTKSMFNVVDVSSLMLTVGHPNGTIAKISAIGSLRLTSGIVLFDVLVVPEYNVSLLSVNKMIKDSKFFVGFDEHKCYIQDLNLGKLVGTDSVTGGLYLFDLDKIGFSKKDHLSPCDICHKAKQTREPFPLSDHKSKSVGDIVHCDVWGPYRVVSEDGFKYFLTIVDDYSRAVWVYLLKSKTEVGKSIKSFIKLVFTQFGKKVKVVRYVVPTGRVVVPTGRYVVPASKVIIIVSPGRLSLVPTCRVLSPGRVKQLFQDKVLARTTLLQSIPDVHVADFHYMNDARDIWNAVKARFGGNAKSKKMRKSMLKQEFSEFRISEAEGLHKGYDRMQKILSQLNQLKAKPKHEDINLKFLRALPSSWSQVALTLKTKGRLELLSLDDLYYKLKTLEVDIKGYSTFSSSQSAGPSHSAFVSTTRASKKMSYADSPSYSSSTYTAPSNSKTGSHRSGNVIEDVLQSFVADTKPEQQLAYEDFEQIEKIDLEEIDLKWQMVMLSV